MTPEDPKRPKSESPSQTPDEEATVWAVLEQARKNVKPLVKQEQEGEVVSSELLNLQLR